MIYDVFHKKQQLIKDYNELPLTHTDESRYVEITPFFYKLLYARLYLSFKLWKSKKIPLQYIFFYLTSYFYDTDFDYIFI